MTDEQYAEIKAMFDACSNRKLNFSNGHFLCNLEQASQARLLGYSPTEHSADALELLDWIVSKTPGFNLHTEYNNHYQIEWGDGGYTHSIDTYEEALGMAISKGIENLRIKQIFKK